MTPTQTERRPQECKHEQDGKCMAHGKEHTCVLNHIFGEVFALYCPDFTPKTEKKCN